MLIYSEEVRERKREGGKEGKRERGKEGKREREKEGQRERKKSDFTYDNWVKMTLTIKEYIIKLFKNEDYQKAQRFRSISISF